MDKVIRLYIFIGVIILSGVVIIYFLLKRDAKQKKLTAEIKGRYDKAIQDGDKALALKLGREYYSRLRGGNLSIYDEQAITNDLLTIK